jgi:flagellar biosynthetic protein FliP
MTQRTRIFWLVVILFLALTAGATGQGLPKITVGVEPSDSPSDLSVTLQIVLLLTVLSLAPSIVIMMTSFTRIVVSLSFLKNALGHQQTPPPQLIIGLALILTFFIMAPTAEKVYQNGVKPYIDGTKNKEEALHDGLQPIQEFMLKQIREKDLGLFIKLSGLPKPQNASELPLRVVLPAFVISELRMAFQIGFVLFIPFLIIDMVVASVLMSMGMLMLPPIMVAMPFKLLMFVLVDGWYLVVRSLVESFH